VASCKAQEAADVPEAERLGFHHMNECRAVEHFSPFADGNTVPSCSFNTPKKEERGSGLGLKQGE
jgi:hypothetical protein